MGAKEHAEQVVRNIRRRTRKQYSAEEKIRIVLEGLRGEESILCWLLGLEPMTRPAITGIAIAGNSVLASTTDNPFFDAHLGSVGDFERNLCGWRVACGANVSVIDGLVARKRTAER